MIRLIVRLLLLLVVAAPVTGTFLQWSLCDNSRGSGIIPFYLNGELTTIRNHENTASASAASVSTPAPAPAPSRRLNLYLVRHQSGIICRDTPGAAALNEDAWPEVTVRLDWSGLGGAESFAGTTRMQLECEDFIGNHRPAWLPVNSSRVSMTLLDDDIGVLPALTTLRLRAYIDSPEFANDTLCIASLLTPAIPPSVSSGLRFGPLAAFLFVFFVSVLRTIAAASRSPHESEDEDSDGSSSAAPAPVVLPSLSDCLHFLQFIFLTSGLSLSFPGFYPAAAGHLNWFALFADLALPIRSFVAGPAVAPVRMSSTYPGVGEGLYAVNGTYGGALGLEVMTQMVGAPMTCDTWLLMVLFTLCIAVGLGVFLWLLEMVRPRNVLGLPLLGHGGAGVRTGGLALATDICNGVLRLVLSYITLPLIALSAYQLNFGGNLGAGHTTLSVIVLVLILLAFAWLAVRLPGASLGALVFEARSRYRHGDDFQEEDGKQARRDHAFVLTLFVLNILRGITIGGLQKWGVAQLAVLAACEVVMLLAVQAFRPFPLLSVGYAATLLRLAVLACFVPFTFHPSEMLRAKSISAYVALFLSAAGMIGVFLMPSFWHLYRLTLQASDQFPSRDVRKDAPIFNLRQLQRRATSRTGQTGNLPSTASPPLPDNRNPASSHNHRYISDRRDLGHRIPPPRGYTRSSRSLSSHFDRLPRSPTPHTPGEASRFSDRSTSGSRVPSPSPPASVPAERPLTNPGGLGYFRSTRFSLSSTDVQGSINNTTTQGSSGSASPTSEAESSRPLGPRWNDYSFREADLFYTAPLPGSAVTAEPPPKVAASSSEASNRSVSWKLLSEWSLGMLKSTPVAPEEKGFSVVRPRRPPPQGPLSPSARGPAALDEPGEDKVL